MNKKRILMIIIILIVILFLMSLFYSYYLTKNEKIENNYNNKIINDKKEVSKKEKYIEDVYFKNCPKTFVYDCLPVTTGREPLPGVDEKMVCGCVPDCSKERKSVVANLEQGKWPDGTNKGSFVCSNIAVA